MLAGLEATAELIVEVLMEVEEAVWPLINPVAEEEVLLTSAGPHLL